MVASRELRLAAKINHFLLFDGQTAANKALAQLGLTAIFSAYYLGPSAVILALVFYTRGRLFRYALSCRRYSIGHLKILIFIVNQPQTRDSTNIPTDANAGALAEMQKGGLSISSFFYSINWK